MIEVLEVEEVERGWYSGLDERESRNGDYEDVRIDIVTSFLVSGGPARGVERQWAAGYHAHGAWRLSKEAD